MKPEENIAYIIVQTKIEKLPFSADTDDYMPEPYRRVYTDSVENDFNPKRDIEFETLPELVREWYSRQSLACPIPISPFDDLLEQTMTGADGQSHYIDHYAAYLECYGLDYANIFWIREISTLAGAVFSKPDAERFVLEHREQLENPRIIPVAGGSLQDDISVWVQ